MCPKPRVPNCRGDLSDISDEVPTTPFEGPIFRREAAMAGLRSANPSYALGREGPGGVAAVQPATRAPAERRALTRCSPPGLRAAPRRRARVARGVPVFQPSFAANVRFSRLAMPSKVAFGSSSTSAICREARAAKVRSSSRESLDRWSCVSPKLPRSPISTTRKFNSCSVWESVRNSTAFASASIRRRWTIASLGSLHCTLNTRHTFREVPIAVPMPPSHCPRLHCRLLVAAASCHRRADPDRVGVLEPRRHATLRKTT